jgi:excisionase family DNA binding protein
VTTETVDRAVLNITETAALLQIDRATASRLIAEGRIPSVRLGPRIVRVPRALLIRQLEAEALAKLEGEDARDG